MVEPVSEELNRRWIAAYRGWHAFEQATGGPAIVDFDLARPGTGKTFQHRHAVLDELAALENDLDGAGDVTAFLRARVQASIAYLRALMGKPIPFDQYVRSTLGVEPVPFSEDTLARARRAVEEEFASVGLEFRSAWRLEFEKLFVIPNSPEILSGILEQKDLWLERLRSFGIPVPPTLRLNASFVDVDALWANWIGGSPRDGFDFSVNLHARKRYLRGSALTLCLHEICGHAAQMAIWAERIAAGALSECCGITVVHGPEAFTSEGLAQTVHLLLGTRHPFPAEFSLRKALQYYSLLVMHNAHLAACQTGNLEQAVAQACDLLPMAHRDEIRHELRQRTKSPLSRSYELSYSAGEAAIREIAARLTSPRLENLFAVLFQFPLTPARMLQYARSLEEEEHGNRPVREGSLGA
jgi:hypothetical protein